MKNSTSAESLIEGYNELIDELEKERKFVEVHDFDKYPEDIDAMMAVSYYKGQREALKRVGQKLTKLLMDDDSVDEQFVADSAEKDGELLHNIDEWNRKHPDSHEPK